MDFIVAAESHSEEPLSLIGISSVHLSGNFSLYIELGPETFGPSRSVVHVSAENVLDGEERIDIGLMVVETPGRGAPHLATSMSLPKGRLSYLVVEPNSGEVMERLIQT